MFFKQVWRNAAKSRKNNGLFFGSLVIAVIAFYTLLSLENQDVMMFLKTVESDAVEKLMMLVPMVYIISLFFVFFLVYFAYRYQLDNRKKEFGLYLMMGMKRRSLFTMLMSETLWNSIISIVIGLPIALLLTEIISLASAKLVGLSIIGHTTAFSLSAVTGTVIGFIMVQMIAMLFLCVSLMRKEPKELLQTDSAHSQVFRSKKTGWASLILGILLLVIAYTLGILLLRTFSFGITLLVLLFGGAGTFLFYRGVGVFIGYRIQRKSPTQSGLYTFTGRQIQENVISQHTSLAISSLLLLVAMACISFGVGIAVGSGTQSIRSVDFSINGSAEEVTAFTDENKSAIASVYPMYIDHLSTDVHEFSWGLEAALEAQPETSLRDNMIENFHSRAQFPYLISQGSYNSLLRSIGKDEIQLEENQVAFFTANPYGGDFTEILSGALSSGAYVEINGNRYEFLPEVYCDNIVADRKITLFSAVIVSDEMYQNLVVDSHEVFCWNLLLSEDFVQTDGLMQAIQSMETTLTDAGLEHESYLKGIGRNLFYTVGGSYITIYLGVLFMLIANTVIGLKFLMQQREDKKRYITLLMLGATTADLCRSSRKQIRLYFALVFTVAMVSSIFAIWALFTSFMKLPTGTPIINVIFLAGAGFFVLILIEFVYIKIVERISNREIQSL